MDRTNFFTRSKVVVVAGKGGVGKSTVSVVLSAAAADAGLRVLLVPVGGRAETGEGVGIDPGVGRIVEGSGTVEVLEITPAMVVSEILARRNADDAGRQLERREQLARLLRSWSPGISSLLILAAIRRLAERTDIDLVVVDAPATGSASLFLRGALAALDTFESGDLRDQAVKAQEMLTDPDRCLITLVALPAEAPVTELIEAAYELEDEVGVMLGPVVLNGVEGAPVDLPTDPDWSPSAELPLSDSERASIRLATRFADARHRLEEREMARLDEELPLPRLELPLVPSVEMDDAALRLLVDHLVAEIGELEQ